MENAKNMNINAVAFYFIKCQILTLSATNPQLKIAWLDLNNFFIEIKIDYRKKII